MKTRNYAIVALAVTLLASCQKKEESYDASGVFETTDVIVMAKGAGQIMTLDVEEGQDVNAGEPVGSIDATQLELQRDQAQAGKRQAAASRAQTVASKASTESKKIDIGQQVASYEQQIANLERERARYQALYRDSAATQKQVDDIDYQIKTLRKQVAAVRDQYATSNTSIDKQGAAYDAQVRGIDAQESQIDAQMAQIDDKIKNYSITSPIKGCILNKYAHAGEYAAPGRALFKVADVSKMILRAYITADQLTRVKLGQKVSVFADMGTSGRKRYTGTIAWISAKAEFTPKTIQTRDERANLVYAIKIAVNNNGGMIKRGMYGDVKF